MNIWYTAIFIKEPEKLIHRFPPKHKKVFAHHVTIEFKPKSLDGIEVGKHWNLEVIGRAMNKKGDALLVRGSKSKNKYPHITLSCASGVNPFYSNELIERAVQEKTVDYFKEPFFVEGVEGYADLKGQVFTNESTKP